LRFHHGRIHALRVQPERGRYVGVAQQILYRLRVLVLVDKEGCEAMPKIVNPESLSRLEHDARCDGSGATRGDTFTGAGQSLSRDLCHHRVNSDLQANRLPTTLVPQTDASARCGPEPHFHGRGCADGAIRSESELLSSADRHSCGGSLPIQLTSSYPLFNSC
jgi:hypothetical protein